MSEYIIKLPNGGAADECIRLSGYEKSLYGYELHEEIVRCSGCAHYTDDEMEYYHYCGNWCEQVEPDGFCKWASRRES